MTLFWYNPNIWPQEEFDLRLEEQQKLIRAMGLEKQVRVVCRPRNSEAWYRATEGLEHEPEGVPGARNASVYAFGKQPSMRPKTALTAIAAH